MSDSTGTLDGRLKALLNLPDDAPPNAKCQRGRDFEEFLQALFETEGLKPRLRLRANGEEIDGSFLLDGRVFLVEAKWHAHPVPASAIYTFKGKVDGKLVSTIGIFVSMSGYSEDAVDALTAGKSLNVLLFDREDVEASVGVNAGFKQALETKLRGAAEEGLVFFPYRSAEVTRADAATDQTLETMSTTVHTWKTDNQYKILVVCEGKIDRHLLSRLAQGVLDREKRRGTVRIVVANGRMNLPRVANSLMALSGKDAHCLVVADGDGNPTGVDREIRDQLEHLAVQTVVVNPSIEAWFFPEEKDPKGELHQLQEKANDISVLETVERLTEDVDIDALRHRSPSFAQVYDFLLNHSGGSGI